MATTPLPEPWPFDQPPNCAVLTTTHVIQDGKDIVSVYHDADDHGWQFHCAESFSMEAGLLVSLKTIIAHDPSVCEMADLPPGWSAHRASAGAEWVREKTPSEDPD